MDPWSAGGLPRPTAATVRFDELGEEMQDVIRHHETLDLMKDDVVETVFDSSE